MNNAEYQNQSDKESLNKDQDLLINDDNSIVWAEEQAKEQVRSWILENFNNSADGLEERQWYEDIQVLLTKKEEALLKMKSLLLKRHKKQWIKPEIERIDQELEKVESDLSKNKEIEYTLMKKKVDLLNMKDLFDVRAEKMRAVNIEKIDQKLDEIDSDISNINLCYLWRWNKEAVLKDVSDNYIKVKECSKKRMCRFIDYNIDPTELYYDPLYETLRYKYRTFAWVELYVDLPKIWSFEWYRTEIFIPIKSLLDDDVETKADVDLREYSIVKFAEALREYLLEFWIEIDKGENYLGTSYGTFCLNCKTEWGRFIYNFICDVERCYRKKYYHS